MTDAQIALQSFALAVLTQWHGGERGDIDGWWLQEAAEGSGVCVETKRVTPCGPVCACEAFNGPGETVYCSPIRDDVFALMRQATTADNEATP
jgi:hypothetical protein